MGRKKKKSNVTRQKEYRARNKIYWETPITLKTILEAIKLQTKEKENDTKNILDQR